MKLAQSPYIPAPGTRPGLADMPWLAAYSARGLCELVRARIIFARLEAKAIPARNRAAKTHADPAAALAAGTLARMSYVLPRISDRLPSRSDCLIQAIAAQNWLSALGASGEIRIGVENPRGGTFGAHAWLVCDGHVVTGGEIDRYDLLLADSPNGDDVPTDTPKGKRD